MFNDYLKTFPQFILPKRRLTYLAGLLANVKSPAVKNRLIRYFIHNYGVNMQEALEENPEHYASFNEFFIRRLKPDARPIAQADVVSPVDGFISELGAIEAGRLLQAKGRYYTVKELLASDAPTLSANFTNGCFATLYLSPKDYHRIHMPMDAVLKEMTYIPGKLFSVQPSSARVLPYLFARNERLAVIFETEVGLMAMVLVGATIVGAIGTSWQGDILRSNKKCHIDYSNEPLASRRFRQGDEMGYFKLGSTVVLLFADGKRVQWLENLAPGEAIRYGQPFAVFA